MKERSPGQRLEAILNAVRNTKPDPAHPTFANLAAGPLEDLLSEHGHSLIERLKVQARQNPSFNLLLGGVWQGGMSNEVWAAVQAMWLKAW